MVLVLKRAFRFVATMLHPIFFTSGAKRCVEIDEDDDGDRKIHRHVKVDEYLDSKARKVTLVLPKPVECGAQVRFLTAKRDQVGGSSG